MDASRIAEVALPISIALNETFDYHIPSDFSSTLKTGCRVLVPFRSGVLLGTVVKIKSRSAYQNVLKPIVKNLDPEPLLDTALLDLARYIQDKYFCSLADAINVMVPPAIKQSRKPLVLEDSVPEYGPGDLKFDADETDFLARKEAGDRLLLLLDPSNQKRWSAYRALIKKTLQSKQSVIVLVPDHRKIDSALQSLSIPCKPIVVSSSVKPQQGIRDWLWIQQQPCSFVIGTRSAVFSPVRNLGLIVIEEEEHFAYRQDQVPHYQAYDIACEKVKKTEAQIVLGSVMPSLETEARPGITKILLPGPDVLAPVRLIDMHREYGFKTRPRIISYILEHRLAEVLEQKGKILLFAHKKGFSTFLYCSHCKTTLTCPRCSSSLRHYFKEKELRCPSCAFKTPLEELCPRCRRAYVKHAGYGLEKIESEIHRLFPSAKTCVYHFPEDDSEASSCDIICASQDFLENPLHAQASFDLVGVLGCEQMLGQVDFRSTERTFARLWQLLLMAKKEMLIQSQMVDHYALTYLAKHDAAGFAQQELDERKDLGLPPLVHLACLLVRGPNQAKTLKAAEAIHKKVKRAAARSKSTEAFAPVSEIPLKKRGNFWYRILIKYKTMDPLQAIIWSCVRQRKGGAIITFDPLT